MNKWSRILHQRVMGLGAWVSSMGLLRFGKNNQWEYNMIEKNEWTYIYGASTAQGELAGP